MLWKIRERTILFDQSHLMGVLNLTPDSFSDGGQFIDVERAFQQAKKMAEEGASILDLGAESTRPNAEPVSSHQELERLLPVLKKIRSELDVSISIDTTKPEVARACLEEGAHIINDVSGLMDSGLSMSRIVQEFDAGLVLMHRRGNPKTMQTMTHYADVTEDVISELEASLGHALGAGIREDQLVIDPGLGFAKTAEQNIEIVRNLEKFHCFNLPILLGPSRKSFIGKVTGREVHDREFGTASVIALGVMKGVQIFRVHEVGAMRDVIRMTEAVRGDSNVRSFQMV